MDAERLQNQIEEIAEEGRQPDGEADIGEHGDEGRAHARRLAQALRHIGEEGAGRDDAPADGGIARREAEQGQRREQEGAGHARAIAARQRDGQIADHRRQRRRRRHDQKDDALRGQHPPALAGFELACRCAESVVHRCCPPCQWSLPG